MNNKRNCFIMGYPSTGKTTFLTALWYVVSNGNIIDNSPIKLNNMGESSYLSSLLTSWIKAEPLIRTSLENENRNISIDLINKLNNTICSLNLPDLSGETFSDIYTSRKIDKELYEMIENADSFLLFENIERIKKPELISELNMELEDSENKNVARNPINDPTSIQLIELLQIIRKINKSPSINLNIILSAWDLVSVKTNPKHYIYSEMNILWQYLMSNENRYNIKFWGVSAQGGDLTEDAEKLIEITDPEKRIIVVDSDGNESNDITLPIMGIMGENDE